MLANAEAIEKYKKRFNPDKHEVFLLIERKTDSQKRENLNSNHFHKGNNLDMLMAMAEIVQLIADKMGLSFDDTMEVMKNVHYQDKVIIRSRFKKRMDAEWEN
jgi:hypothetical protein